MPFMPMPSLRAVCNFFMSHLFRPPALSMQKYAGLLFDVAAKGVPVKEAAISTAKAAGVDLEKVREA